MLINKVHFVLALVSSFVFGLPSTMFAQEIEATTADGKTVILYADQTWKYKPESTDSVNVVETDTAVSVVAVRQDTVVAVSAPPEKPKGYTETSTGFKGFLKPEVRFHGLPDRADGVYEFRVKINKEGVVREVMTLVHGPHGGAEQIMRNTITKLKYIPDGTLVPPLTEGVIKVTVAAGK